MALPFGLNLSQQFGFGSVRGHARNFTVASKAWDRSQNGFRNFFLWPDRKERMSWSRFGMISSSLNFW